jgi:guanylate kinase
MTARRGKLIVISAPSGCGKTTIANALLDRHPDFTFSVSATTRSKRRNEKHGTHYYFLSNDEFHRAIERNELVEWEEIYGNYYGTLKYIVDEALAGGRILLFDVDVKGGLSIKKQYPEDAVLIFIEPPSFEVLKNRLTRRNTEDEVQLRKRLERVPMELELGKSYDYSVVNDDLKKAVDDVDRIVYRELHASEGTSAPPGI